LWWARFYEAIGVAAWVSGHEGLEVASRTLRNGGTQPASQQTEILDGRQLRAAATTLSGGLGELKSETKVRGK
jgi:hypothetical protein